MAAKKMPAKKAVATRRSADATAGAKTAGLARLGRYLSARGTGGSADAMAARGSARAKNLQNAVAASRGGGQGKASPMATKMTGSMMSKKTVSKSVPPKRTATTKPGFAAKNKFK